MRDWDLQTLFDRGMLDDAIVRDELFDDIANGSGSPSTRGSTRQAPTCTSATWWGFVSCAGSSFTAITSFS